MPTRVAIPNSLVNLFLITTDRAEKLIDCHVFEHLAHIERRWS